MHGACDSFADEYTDPACGADADAWEGAFDVRAPMVPGGSSAEVRGVVGKGVEFLRGDDGGVGVAKERFEAGSGGAAVGDNFVVRKAARRGLCRP